MSKAELRSKLLASTQKPPTVVEYNGVKVGIKIPTVREREDLSKDAKDDTHLVAQAICALAVDLEDNQPLFDDTDIAEMVNQQVGGIIDVLGEAIINAIKGGEDAKKPT